MFQVTTEPINSEKLREQMNDSRAGGFVCFEGWVRNRNEGKEVSSLEYEAFAELCEKEAAIIFKECQERFEIFSISCVHRIGHLQLNEIAVWIGISSAHRDNAFRACRYIIDEIKLRLPIWKKEHYVHEKAEWVNCKECYKHSHHYHSHDEEEQYYKRQVALKQVGEIGQQKLKKARAIVVGAGGLGCPVLEALAGAGVHDIRIIEHDRLDISNLHRQPLYSFHDAGKHKVYLAQEALKKYNPFVHITAIEQKLTFTNALNLLSEADVVLDCTDNFNAKLLVHDICYQQKIPLVCAAVYQLEGEVQVFLNQNQSAPCLRCLWSKMPDKNCVQSCEESGVLGTVPAIVGQIQAKLAIDILLGRKVEEKKLLISIDSMEIEKISLSKNKDCWLCGNPESVLTEELYLPIVYDWEIAIETPQELEKYTLIDIRDSLEREIKNNTNDYLAKNAMSGISDYTALDKTQHYLLICQKGIRSQRLTKNLREKNLHHFYSLTGGTQSLQEKI